MKAGIDSSVIVALLNRAHEKHASAVRGYESMKREGAEFVVTDTALLETFSVLTRAPAPIGIGLGNAFRVLRENFASASVAPLRPGAAWDIMELAFSRGFAGGRVHDATIALVSFEAGARVLLTYNVRHFLSIAPAGLEVREP